MEVATAVVPGVGGRRCQRARERSFGYAWVSVLARKTGGRDRALVRGPESRNILVGSV